MLSFMIFTSFNVIYTRIVVLTPGVITGVIIRYNPSLPCSKIVRIVLFTFGFDEELNLMDEIEHRIRI